MAIYQEHLILTTDHELSPGLRIQLKHTIQHVTQSYGVTKVEHAPDPSSVVIFNHHVVLNGGRKDIVCSCGKHFVDRTWPNGECPDTAISQWAKHYNDTKEN